MTMNNINFRFVAKRSQSMCGAPRIQSDVTSRRGSVLPGFSRCVADVNISVLNVSYNMFFLRLSTSRSRVRNHKKNMLYVSYNMLGSMVNFRKILDTGSILFKEKTIYK